VNAAPNARVFTCPRFVRPSAARVRGADIPDKHVCDLVELRWLSTCSSDSVPYSGDRIVADADLTLVILRDIQEKLVILRDIQSRLASVEKRLGGVEEKLDVTNERLSMVERGTTFCAAQINVMRRQMLIEDKKTDAEILDLQVRVARLEDLVKP
jgi:hypothetical protein